MSKRLWLLATASAPIATTLLYSTGFFKSAEKDKEELERLVKTWPDLFRVPNRGDICDPNVAWLTKSRSYTKADLSYNKGKIRSHRPGSPEVDVENLVKLWEFEASHKANIEQWDSISDLSKYTVQVNQLVDGTVVPGPTVPGSYAKEIGNYGALMAQCPRYQELMKKKRESDDFNEFHESHDLFRKAMPDGFPWEVMDITNFDKETMTATFTWRHWGKLNGEWTPTNKKGDDRHVEMRGNLTAKVAMVDGCLKIQNFSVTLDNDSFLRQCAMEVQPDDPIEEKTIYDETKHGSA